jgi:hypothetical protein
LTKARKGNEAMKTNLTLLAAAAAAVALTAAAPSFADNAQLVAAAGLTPAEAAGLSLTEIAQAKFNRDLGAGDRVVIVDAGVASAAGRTRLAANAGVAPDAAQAQTLTEIAAAKFNRESAADDRQRVERGSVTLASRSVRDQADRAQLIGSAGLTQDAAEGLSLTDIARAKFARDTYN